MNLDSLEGSIQNLLSVLYPPFEATAPTLLSQLVQIIEGRYQGDALRCLLDFLVPAKHILDSVQQAACAQYSDVLFLCEGWPLCLRDQVVVHLAPINPLLLQPGDFYLQVVPFGDQSARILVCSLLEEDRLGVDFVEETPIPETSYPCIFSTEWLKEINQDRYGPPLRQCLLATEKGVVRLPWERVAVPDFLDVPQLVGISMASVPPTYHPIKHPLPPPPPSHFSKTSSSSHSFRLPPAKDSAPKQCNLPNPNPISASSSHHPAYSVKTKICPAKHGIAVSLCLVDTKPASSLVFREKEAETEPKPIGWVSPTTWDSRFTESGTDKVIKTRVVSGKYKPESVNTCIGANAIYVAENIKKENQAITKPLDISKGVPTGQAAAEGEYIDILQATMLFSKSPSVPKEQKTVEMQRQSLSQTEAQMSRYPQRQVQAQHCAPTEPCWQTQPSTQMIPQTHSPEHAQLSDKTQTHSHSRLEPGATSLSNVFAGAGPPSADPCHSQSRRNLSDFLEASQCVRTVQFAEKPCTPCMKRRQGGIASKATELRCRYRDSYQAAIQNPVPFGKERERMAMLAVVEENGDFAQCERQKPTGTKTGDPCSSSQGLWCDPEVQSQFPFSISGAICKESGEINTVSYRKPGDAQRGTNPPESGRPAEEPAEKNTVRVKEVRYSNSAKPMIRKDSAAGTNVNTKDGLPYSSGEISGSRISAMTNDRSWNKTNSSGMSPNISKSLTGPQNRRESMSDGRCSSLSTAVVDTSEKCELVIVEGRNVRRREPVATCAEVPQLHVVKCKNSTAFGLVSPKINRRRMVIPDGAQTGDPSLTCRNRHQAENLPQTDPPLAAGTQRISQPASARPRPDHLPLGSPDPRAQPLYLGVASLTGGRDRMGRAIVEVYGEHQGWLSTITSRGLYQMLLYFHSITRRELREAGMTIVFDARKTSPQPQVYKALMTLQEHNPPTLNSLVLLVDRDNRFRPQPCPGLQTDTVSSTKALLKLVEACQLSSRLDGTLCHSHCDWMELHQKLFPFVCDLHEATILLMGAISKLEEPQRTDTFQIVQQCMTDQRTLMKDVLENSGLVSLQRDGGAILARLRRESDLKYPHCEDLSDAVDSVTSLYNHMEEQAHVLVQKSNISLEHLEYLKQLREMEGHFIQMQQWYNIEGERHLLEAESVEDSGDRMEQILNSFTAFLIEANDRRHHAMSLVSEAERLQRVGHACEETEAFVNLVGTFKSGMEDFLYRAEASGRELQIMVNVCDFCEQAAALASECTDYLDQGPANNRLVRYQNQASGAGQSECPAAPGSDPTTAGDSKSVLQTFHDRLAQFSPEKFQEVKAEASALRGSRGMRVWNAAWLRCHEARQRLQERMQAADEVTRHDSNGLGEGPYIDVDSANIQTTPPGGQSLVVQSTPGPRHPQWQGVVSGAVDLGKVEPIPASHSANSPDVAGRDARPKPEGRSEAGTSQGSKVIPQSPNRSPRRAERGARRKQAGRSRRERDAAALSQSHTVGCQWFPWGRALKARSASQDSGGLSTPGTSTPPERRVWPPSSCSHRGQPSCRILKEAQKFQISRHGSFCSEDSCMSDRCGAGPHGGLGCKHSSLPTGRYEGPLGPANPQGSASNAQRLQRVLNELVITEREYVRSLSYILTHYLPLLDRPDIPQDLRGKRGVIFGNLEKLFNFHSHYFLPELEACQREPAMVARCFLRHSESFGLYALYSKNKPQSDALILYRRHDIFKKKQQELGDMMDLSSYLLRPIQRISKYSLLLQDMLALAGSHSPKDAIQEAAPASAVLAPDLTSGEREREKAEVRAAADLVRFQMRHGNDLLTMDAIRDCDVNLKEQGQLIRQDEFTVLFRKKKCLRRVFLFADLILFSKTKKTDVGNDVYVYKQSFKTSDIGMTHTSALGGLCFEIWFRRRKSEDTYTLKAPSVELKKAWTADLEKILWDQAAHSRELRMQERVFMGVGRRPFMDIQPSDAAICDRAVGCSLLGRIPVACCSHRGLDYPRPHSIGSGSTASTTVSQSSSSSGRGSLPPAGYPGNHSQGTETGPALGSSPEAVTDNELNGHHPHQHHRHRHCDHEQWRSHRPLTDSTGSPGERMEVFSSLDHSCLSAVGGETADDSSSSASQCSRPRPAPCRTPSLRVNSSPAMNRKQPGAAARPPHLAYAQTKEVLISKSTEV